MSRETSSARRVPLLPRHQFAWVWIALVALVASACAGPPNKEMDRAQGAIDAALAAGADEYATNAYNAATEALRNAQDAVALGDYRLALSHALASHEYAQSAASEAAANRAQVRGEVERAMAELRARLAEADSRLDLARRSRRPRGDLAEAADLISAVREGMSEADDAIARGEYLLVRPTLDGLQEQLERASALVAPPPS